MKTVKSDVYARTCIQLTFDLILGLGAFLDLASTPMLLKTHKGTL